MCCGAVIAGCSSSRRTSTSPRTRAARRRPRSIASPTRCSNRRSTRFRRERYPEAESLLKELTARDPMLSGPWVNLGAVYEALGDNDAAKRAYKKAIDANPNNCAAYVDLGVLSRRAGDFLSAEANYLACTQRVAELSRGVSEPRHSVRAVSRSARRRAEGVSDLSDVCRKVPTCASPAWVSDLERRLAGNES